MFYINIFLTIPQGVLLCPQTLSQARRNELHRAFTDATGETTYGHMVYSHDLYY